MFMCAKLDQESLPKLYALVLELLSPPVTMVRPLTSIAIPTQNISWAVFDMTACVIFCVDGVNSAVTVLPLSPPYESGEYDDHPTIFPELGSMEADTGTSGKLMVGPHKPLPLAGGVKPPLIPLEPCCP